jgi:hypothetical protein
MKAMQLFAVVAVVAVLTIPAAAQEFPKPGPEHEHLKKLEGTWNATMKVMGQESKGTMTYKMELGGLWLTSHYEGDFLGQKFQGRGLDSYDAGKKKYVSVWVDNMITTPLVMEGTYDKDKKAMTMVGDMNGPDGKPAKFTAVTHFKSDDEVHFEAFMGDSKEPGFTITYKRKK